MFSLHFIIFGFLFGFVFVLSNTFYNVLAFVGFGLFGNPLLTWNIIFCPVFLFLFLLYCLRSGVKGTLSRYAIKESDIVKLYNAIKILIVIGILVVWAFGIRKYVNDMNNTKELLSKSIAFTSEAETHESYISVKKPYVRNLIIMLVLTTALYLASLPIANRIIEKHKVSI